MRLAVIGSSGRLGQAVSRVALERGHQVLQLSHADFSLPVPSPEAWLRLCTFAPQSIINCAAFTQVAAAQHEAAAAFAVNALGVKTLLNYCKRRHCLLVQVSSDYVLPPVCGPHREAPSRAQWGELNTYGQSKLIAEKYCLHAGGALIVRTGSLYGAPGDLVTRLLQAARQALANGTTLDLIADNLVMPTPYGFVAAGLTRLCEQPPTSRTGSLIYHCVGAQALSVYDFAADIFAAARALGLLPRMPAMRALSYAAYLKQYPQVRRSCDLRLDCTQLRQATSLTPPPLENSLQSYLQTLLQERL